MNISFESLKTEFKEYLESLGIKPKLNEDDELTSASIFTYSKEFKEFVSDEYEINLDKDKLDFSSLLESEVEDGKFVLSEDDSKNKDMAFMLELLNGLFEEEEFAQNIDEDNQDGLSEEEIKKFLTFTSELNSKDEDNEFSFGDLEKGIEKVKDGKYDASKISLEEAMPEVQAPSAPNSVGSGSSGNSYSGNNNVKTQNNAQENTVKNYSQMETSELEDAYVQQQSVISTQTQNINATMEQNEIEIAKAKEAYDLAISEDNIDPTLLESRNENLNAITETDNAINDLNANINTLSTQIGTYDSVIAMLDSNISALNSALSSLSSAPSDDEEAQKAVEAKRTAINQEIASLEQEKQTALSEKTALEEQRTQAQTSLDENTTKLSELEIAKMGIEEQIVQTCNENTKIALDNYNAIREAADVVVQTAKTSLEGEKEKLGEIQKYLNASYQKDIEKEYSYKEKSDTFIENNGYSEVQDIKKLPMDYKVLAANGADTDKELPVIVYLHGAKGSKNSLQSQILNSNYLNAKGVTTAFNGYIICPTTSRSSWDNEASAKDIEQILTEFSKTHKIDKDNIVIAGHSLGGTGALYMADSPVFKDSDGFKFKKAAALTGYPSELKDYDIPIGLWVDSGSQYLLNNNVLPNLDINGEDKYVNLVGQAHSDIDNIAFTQDSDGNGKTDLLEWLFDEN